MGSSTSTRKERNISVTISEADHKAATKLANKSGSMKLIDYIRGLVFIAIEKSAQIEQSFIELPTGTTVDKNKKTVSIDLMLGQKPKIQSLADKSGLSLSTYVQGLVSIAVQKNTKLCMSFVEIED